MSFFQKRAYPNIQSVSPRDSRRRRRAILFWAAQALLFTAAVVVRIASPSAILTPLQVLRPGTLTPSNVCSVVNERLIGITSTSAEDTPALSARVASLDAYLQSVLFRIPQTGDALFTPEFVKNIHALKSTCERCKTPLQPYAAADLQVEIIAFRSNFRDLMRRAPRPAPVWYLHLARGATGLLEGFSAPAVLLWRTTSCFIAGKASLKLIVNPGDWRRVGPVFVVALFYGSLLCAYLFAWLAQKTKHTLVTAPGLLAVAYSTLHLFYAIVMFW